MSSVVLYLTVLSLLRQVTSIAPASCLDEPVAAAWYMSPADGSSLSEVSWDKYNTLIYSFALTTEDVHSLSLGGSDPSLLTQFVSEAHDNGVAAHYSVGGWTGSRFFSSNVATPENRTAFVNTVVDFAQRYNLDGINFDWEYPNHQGIGCNAVNADDTEHLLFFLQALRGNPAGSQLTLSAATSIIPFYDASGSPSTNVSGFAEVLDYIAIMDYDVFGSWSTGVGPNAPLNDTCAPPTDRIGSAASAVNAWTTAGMPLNKIVLGVPAYGHSFSVAPHDAFVNGSRTDLASYPNFNASNQPLGDSDTSTGSVDVCGVKEGPGGTFTFKGLVDHGFLDEDGHVAPGIYYRFDNCSQTPYVYNETSEVMISYDDTRSFAAKGNFIKQLGLRGFSMWQEGGDYNNLLVNSIRTAVGLDNSTAKTSKRNWNWNL